MAAKFYRTAAGGAGTGADWANAYTTLVAAYAGMAAGDTLWWADDNAESVAVTTNLTSPGTVNNPCFLYCVDHTVASPGPGDLKLGSTYTVTGNSSLGLLGSFYSYGINWILSPGANAQPLNIDTSAVSHSITIEAGSLQHLATVSANIVVGNTSAVSACNLKLINSTLSVGNVGSAFALRGTNFVWLNTASAIQGATIPTSLFKATASGGNLATFSAVTIEGVDLSAMGSGKTIVAAFAAGTRYSLIRCKLGASVTIAATPSTTGLGYVDAIQCDSGATNYFQSRFRYEGTLTQETAIVRSGGASDGTTPLSWKIASTANSKWLTPFESFPIAIWNDTVGSPVTATVEIVAAGALNNDDVWLEVEYLGDAASPQASFANSTKANNLATGTALAASTATWASSPGAPQKLSVTFTPQMKGDVVCRVYVGKAAQTVYVDPYPTLS